MAILILILAALVLVLCLRNSGGFTELDATAWEPDDIEWPVGPKTH